MSVSFSFEQLLQPGQAPMPVRGFVTRVFDLVLVSLVLILSAPVMVLIAVAILVEDGRPIFFSQLRFGRGGHQFWMLKFRKFAASGDQAGCPLTMEDDPRLTRIGAVLARTKLDELPQLWNVFKGEMAVVGPRPESLRFADCFSGSYRMVLNYKPGVFGPSQLIFRNECALYRGRPDPEQFYREVLFPLKAGIDLAYFAQRTLFRDVMWVVRGALAVMGCSSGTRQAAILVKDVEEQNRAKIVGRSRAIKELPDLAEMPAPGATASSGERRTGAR